MIVIYILEKGRSRAGNERWTPGGSRRRKETEIILTYFTEGKEQGRRQEVDPRRVKEENRNWNDLDIYFREGKEQGRRREVDPKKVKEENERIRRRWNQIKVKPCQQYF